MAKNMLKINGNELKDSRKYNNLKDSTIIKNNNK